MEHRISPATSRSKPIGPKLQLETVRHFKSSSLTSELFSLPDLSEESEEESSTMKSAEVRMILEKSSIINAQVKLRLAQLIEKSKLLGSALPDVATKESSTRGTSKGSITIDPEYLNLIKVHQDYLVKLFEQLSLLQDEVKLNYLKITDMETIEKNFSREK